MNHYVKNIIGYLHLLLCIFKYIYGYVFPSILLFDSLYIILFAIIPLSWIFFKGECILSYFIKKYEDNNYKLGDESSNYKDMSDLFPNNKVYSYYSYITTFVYIGSLVIVNNRTKIIPNYTFYIILILFLLYLYDIELFNSYYTKLFSPYFQIILIIVFTFVIYNSSKKIINIKKNNYFVVNK